MIKMQLLMTANSLFITQAAAYIDPATTSYVIQIVVGIVIAVGTAVGIFWNKIARLFKKKNTDAAPSAAKNERKEHGGIVTAEDLMADDDEK